MRSGSVSGSGSGVASDSLGDKSLKTGSDSVGGNSLTTNLDDAVKLTVPVLSDSPGDVGETVDGSVMDRSPVETISVCVTSVTAGGSGSTSRLPLESVGLNSDGGKGTAAGDAGGSTSESEIIDGTTEGILAGGVGALSERRSTANERGVLASDGMVLHTEAVSNCVERSHSQMSAVTNSVSVSVLHISAVTNSVETSERQISAV